MSKNLIYSTSEYTHSYSGFRGVELNGSASITSKDRLAYAENMYKDYDGDGADVIESIPGFRRILSVGEKVHALYYQRRSVGEDCILVHSGNKLRLFPVSCINGEADTLPPPIATLKDEKSRGFSYGGALYVMDGEKIVRIDETGVCRVVAGEDNPAYVPTTYVSGKKYEERNLLTDKFNEEFLISDPSAYYYSSDGIKYVVTDPLHCFCSVSGISEDAPTDVYIPSTVTLFGTEYRVNEIGDYAFEGNKRITSVYISEGISRVGIGAFYGCSSLGIAVTPSSLDTFSNGIFTDCISLSRLYVGSGVKSFGLSAFNNCTSLEEINYALDEESYKSISGISEASTRKIIYESVYKAVKIHLPMHEDTSSIDAVTVDGVTKEFTPLVKNGLVTHVLLDFATSADATGIKVKVSGNMTNLEQSFDSEMSCDGGISGYDAVMGCTIAAVFDGRIFFSGNPKLPNTVFYSDNGADGEFGELYIGRYSYFNDGVGGYKVCEMLAVRDMLAIFKEGDDGVGSIFYHKREFTDSDTVSTIYPVAYVHSGICAKGAGISFLDDPVFLTAEGLSALNSENINYYRSVACRSHNVNFSLLKEDLKRANLCVWNGYLVIGINGKAYLADSRATFIHSTKNREYEWFVLSGIGTYTADRTIYVYADEPLGDARVYEGHEGEETEDVNVYDAYTESGEAYFYVVLDGERKRVLPTEERCGGVFHPAACFMSQDKYLFFATDAGDVCVFNNDKRGVAPDFVREAPDFDEDVYQRSMGNKIHPYFYDFASHRAHYTVKTALDDCGIPHLTKSSVKKSLVVKARAYYPDAISCEVATDRQDGIPVASFPYASGGFDDFSFDEPIWATGKYTSTALAEKEKKWVEKQIILSSNRFRSPISVYSITYRYTIKGKIKNNA